MEPDAPLPPPAPPPRRRRGLVIAILLLVITGVIAAFLLLKEKPAAPEALPVSQESTEDVQSLPLPSASEIASAYGGLSPNTQQQSLVTKVGNIVATKSDAAKAGGVFRFYVLADENRINVFAMPDGTIFITSLLLNHLKTEGQLAGMLAHEIAQVTGHNTPRYLATGLVTYSRDDEIKADAGAVRTMSQAGYDPTALINTLMTMRDINTSVPVEFFLSHPSPVNRIARIEYAIKLQYPDGVPETLSD